MNEPHSASCCSAMLLISVPWSVWIVGQATAIGMWSSRFPNFLAGPRQMAASRRVWKANRTICLRLTVARPAQVIDPSGTTASVRSRRRRGAQGMAALSQPAASRSCQFCQANVDCWDRVKSIARAGSGRQQPGRFPALERPDAFWRESMRQRRENGTGWWFRGGRV